MTSGSWQTLNLQVMHDEIHRPVTRRYDGTTSDLAVLPACVSNTTGSNQG